MGVSDSTAFRLPFPFFFCYYTPRFTSQSLQRLGLLLYRKVSLPQFTTRDEAGVLCAHRCIMWRSWPNLSESLFTSSLFIVHRRSSLITQHLTGLTDRVKLLTRAKR